MSIFIIAEAGSNHCGELGKARELISSAADAGVDAVKFQAFSNRIWNVPRNEHLQMDFDFFAACAEECAAFGVEFMCSPFYPEAVEMLDPLVERWKVGSMNAGDKPLLDAIRATGKPVLMSMGLVPPEKVLSIRDVFPLHCVTAYPARPGEYALLEWLARAGEPLEWGISDHSVGLGASIAAVALGATVVEKHICLAKQPPSPDDGPHALRPKTFRILCLLLRQAREAAYGRLGEPRIPAGRRVWKEVEYGG